MMKLHNSGIIHHIHRNIACTRQLGDLLVNQTVIGCRNDQHHAIKMRRFETRDDALNASLLCQCRIDLWCDHAHFCTRIQQHAGLALGDITAADHQAKLAFDVNEDWQKIHAI